MATSMNVNNNNTTIYPQNSNNSNNPNNSKNNKSLSGSNNIRNKNIISNFNKTGTRITGNPNNSLRLNTKKTHIVTHESGDEKAKMLELYVMCSLARRFGLSSRPVSSGIPTGVQRSVLSVKTSADTKLPDGKRKADNPGPVNGGFKRASSGPKLNNRILFSEAPQTPFNY